MKSKAIICAISAASISFASLSFADDNDRRNQRHDNGKHHGNRGGMNVIMRAATATMAPGVRDTIATATFPRNIETASMWWTPGTITA